MGVFRGFPGFKLTKMKSIHVKKASKCIKMGHNSTETPQIQPPQSFSGSPSKSHLPTDSAHPAYSPQLRWLKGAGRAEIFNQISALLESTSWPMTKWTNHYTI